MIRVVSVDLIRQFYMKDVDIPFGCTYAFIMLGMLGPSMAQSLKSRANSEIAESRMMTSKEFSAAH